MKQVQKKSADAAANQMITAAYRRQVNLIWDRMEAMQPQCGFGRMGACCTDCMEGPCRINPFEPAERLGTCGRTPDEFNRRQLLQRAADGAAALAELAVEFGSALDSKTMASLLTTSDTMLATAFCQRLQRLGQAAAEALAAIRLAKQDVLGQRQAAVTDANLGALRLSAANIVLHGHIAPKAIKLLADAAAKSDAPVSLAAMCGSEISGALNIPALTNYESQELPLLTGAVDMLVTGSQCVMPAVHSLAAKLGTPVALAQDIDTAEQAEAVVAAAVKAYQRRTVAQLTDSSEVVCVGSNPESVNSLLASLVKGWLQGQVQGVAYLSGCGHVANTQDAGIVSLAKQLLAANYVIITAGCAGTALAKAGLCQPNYPVSEQLRKSLPEDMPAVLYLGSCQEAGEFLAIAKELSKEGVPVLAVMPEITHNKILTTAIAFAVEGIPAYIGLDEAFALPPAGLSAPLLSLAELNLVPSAWTEAAAK